MHDEDPRTRDLADRYTILLPGIHKFLDHTGDIGNPTMRFILTEAKKYAEFAEEHQYWADTEPAQTKNFHVKLRDEHIIASVTLVLLVESMTNKKKKQ